MEQRASRKSLSEYTTTDKIRLKAQYICAMTTNRSYRCDTCDIQFINEIDLINHNQIHAVRKNRCSNADCKITFQVYTSLYEHNYKEHELFPKYICPYCSKNYRRYLNYYYHSIQEHECRCDICFEKRPDYPTLLIHYKERHPEEKKREIERYNRAQEKKLRELLEFLEDLNQN